MPLPVGQRVTVRFEKLERSGHYVAEQGSNRKRLVFYSIIPRL
jgi:hypothetical protein